MIARYRRMPRGRPAIFSWSLTATELLRHRLWTAELLICVPQQLRYCKPATNFGLRAPLKRREFATVRFNDLFDMKRRFRYWI